MMHQSNAKLILCLFFFFSFYGASIAQNLDISGNWTTVNADNCCSGNEELSSGEARTYDIPSTLPYNSVYFLLRGGDGGYAKAGSSCKSEGGDGATVRATFSVGPGADQLNPVFR